MWNQAVICALTGPVTVGFRYRGHGCIDVVRERGLRKAEAKVSCIIVGRVILFIFGLWRSRYLSNE